jgi:hypothetical protein
MVWSNVYNYILKFFMSKSTIEANKIIALIKQGKSVKEIKDENYPDLALWHNYSAKAYAISLEQAKKERKKDEANPHVAATSNDDIAAIISLNEKLGDYALTLSTFSTMPEFNTAKSLALNLPSAEESLIEFIGKIIMEPRLRALQKRGRIEPLPYFKVSAKMVDAAVLCYYRGNYISCYLTLVPVIEGVINRWMGYTGADTKPEFDEIKKFFKHSHTRQPCPSNILFHQVYNKACDKILNHHFYKHTASAGTAHANFNRHVASHLLNDDEFGTRANCIRLFILLDAMTEIYVYESRESDPRFSLHHDAIVEDVVLFTRALLENTPVTPEQVLLGS